MLKSYYNAAKQSIKEAFTNIEFDFKNFKMAAATSDKAEADTETWMSTVTTFGSYLFEKTIAIKTSMV